MIQEGRGAGHLQSPLEEFARVVAWGLEISVKTGLTCFDTLARRCWRVSEKRLKGRRRRRRLRCGSSRLWWRGSGGGGRAGARPSRRQDGGSPYGRRWNAAPTSGSPRTARPTLRPRRSAALPVRCQDGGSPCGTRGAQVSCLKSQVSLVGFPRLPDGVGVAPIAGSLSNSCEKCHIKNKNGFMRYN